MLVRVLLLLLLFFAPLLNAQERLPNLLDSLTQATSPEEKVRLGMAIASHLAQEDWKRALQFIDLAETDAEDSDSEKTMADYHIAVAEIYSKKDAWDISLNNLVKAYAFYKDKPLEDRYRLENDLAIAYSETKNPKRALELYHKIYKYEQTQENPINLASIANNIGLVWLDKDRDSSRHYFNQSLELIKDIEYPYLKILVYTNLGISSVLEDDPEEAKRYFRRALDEIGPNTINEDLGWVYGEFSELYLKNHQVDSAIYYSEKAVKILDSFAPYSKMQLQSMEVLYKSYLEMKDFEKATKTFEKFMDISDSLNLQERRINAQKIILEEEYRTKEKMRELRDSRIRANIYTLIFGLLALLLVLGILMYRYRNRFKRAELQRQLATIEQKEQSMNLELKNKELIGKAMVEMHRAEMIDDILKDLKAIKLKANTKETQNAIDYIVKRLKKDTSKNSWDEFELRFKEVHESFYGNLLLHHPDLTPRDQRLCALLKLNLTTKEISQITGQSLKSVENARTRLRRKLNITNSQTNLPSYLSNFG